MISSHQSIFDNLTARVFSLQKDDVGFENLALDIFKLQYKRNKVYKEFADAIGVKVGEVNSLTKIPFLPIEFFKTQKIITEGAKLNNPVAFTSSGTTQTGTSIHYVNDITLYEKSFTQCFNLFFGKPSDYCVLALLPSYLERTGSSLVYMAQKLIDESHHPKSGFYLDNYDDLIKTIEQLKQQKQKTLLLGVSYALLDLADKNISLLNNFIVMETGGMKGRRKEMLKEELHAVLKEKLNLETITSEYGMTELLSQAYSLQNGLFQNPPWMRVLTRDTNDPFSFTSPNKTGGINVIDLANLNSCSFIATQDLGKIHPNNTFELMGRFDNSDIRGCNLLIN
ncbi:MAG TPA: acyl transferase [Bacteroidia bacterium]|nr:acyl transferase [Bacteroidia bacterium]